MVHFGQHAPIHLLAYLDFIGNPTGLNLVNHLNVGYLGSLVHDHPQGLYLGDQSFIFIVAIPIAITTTRSKHGYHLLFFYLFPYL
jgi:hypothetical protein